jgi:pimeloyl-ACP methyl ester carboxylesterase
VKSPAVIRDDDDIATHSVRARDGVQLAVHRLGPDDGTPVVLFPGTFSNARFWLGTRGVGLARTLAAAGFQTWSVDPRGHGDSERPHRGARWSFDQWARADAPAIIEEATKQGRAAIAIGHSAGGVSLLAALAAEPELRNRVRATVIIATPLPWLQPWRWLGAHLLRAAARRLDTFPARLLRLGPEDEPAGVLHQWMDWNVRGRRAAPVEGRAPVAPTGCWIGDDGADYIALLSTVATPILALAGHGDRIFAPVAACQPIVDLVTSEDARFLACGRSTGFSRDFGHGDIVASHAAKEEVWPRILEWVSQY